MAEQPVSNLMVELVRRLAPIEQFFMESSWSKRNTDPTICDFVAGNPHDPALPEITNAILRWAVPENKDWYAYQDNVPRAREAAARALRAETGTAYEPEDIFLTPGTFGALSVSMRTVVDRDDEVIFLSPPWFFYEAMILLTGATPVRVTLSPPTFEPDLAAIEAAITPRTRAIIVNSPNNPVGTIYSPDLLRDLAGILTRAVEKHGRRIFLLSDESYRRILFDGKTFTSPAEFYPDTLVLYTYGKQLLAPGQRLGYIALPPTMENRDVLRNVMFMAQVAGGWQFPNAVMQYALPELEGVIVDLAHLQRRRDRLVEALGGMGYEPTNPEATFYILARSPVPDDVAFTEQLAEHDVFVLPGTIFELPGWIRLSITANDDMIERGIPGFERGMKQARG